MVDIEEIRKVEISPNDVVVVRFSGKLSNEATEMLERRLRSVFPNNKCVILDNHTSMSVFAPRDGE